MSSRTRRRVEEHESHDRWLVSYADFITLLFAFFVVLYATSSQNEEKEKKFEESIRANFKMLSGQGQSQNETGGVLGQVINPIDVFQSKNVGNGELEDYVERLLQKNMSQEERKLAIGGLRHDSMGVRISLAAETFFSTGHARLKEDALKSLDAVAKILKASDRQLIIEGHTDDQKIVSGPITSNWELASLRATSVVRYLIQYHGIEPSRLAAISYADTKPLAPNDTPENRARNRRIEILIVNGPGKE